MRRLQTWNNAGRVGASFNKLERLASNLGVDQKFDDRCAACHSSHACSLPPHTISTFILQSAKLGINRGLLQHYESNRPVQAKGRSLGTTTLALASRSSPTCKLTPQHSPQPQPLGSGIQSSCSDLETRTANIVAVLPSRCLFSSSHRRPCPSHGCDEHSLPKIWIWIKAKEQHSGRHCCNQWNACHYPSSKFFHHQPSSDLDESTTQRPWSSSKLLGLQCWPATKSHAACRSTRSSTSSTSNRH